AVPDNRLRRFDRAGVRRGSQWTDVEHRLILWNRVSSNGLRLARAVERRRDHRVVRQGEARAGTIEKVLCHRHAVLLDERLPGLETHSLVEGARHGAADQQSIDLWQQLLDDVDLARYLGAAE